MTPPDAESRAAARTHLPTDWSQLRAQILANATIIGGVTQQPFFHYDIVTCFGDGSYEARVIGLSVLEGVKTTYVLYCGSSVFNWTVAMQNLWINVSEQMTDAWTSPLTVRKDSGARRQS